MTTTITEAAPHHLLADGEILAHEPTIAGDMQEKGVKPQVKPVGVGLGVPTYRVRPD